MLKVFLLNPPTLDGENFIREGRCTQEEGIWSTVWPPVSLCTLAAMLRAENIEVHLRDCSASGLKLEELMSQMKSISPDIIIWSTGTPSIISDLKIAEIFKAHFPTTKTAVFGTHVTALDEKVLNANSDIDFIIRNEPEETAVELIKAIKDQRDIKTIEGLSFIEKGRFLCNPTRDFIGDLDSMPMPAWDLINIEDYKLPLINEKYLIVAPLRGCPYSCSFCTCQTYYGKKLRKKKVSLVVDEIEFNKKHYGVDHIFFWAETFVLDRNYIKDLCNEMLKRKVNIRWVSNSRTDIITQDLMNLMAKSGCFMMSFGIETGNQEVLDLTKKGTKVNQARECIEWAREAGITTVGHFILGLPGETKESMEQTIQYAKEVGVHFAQFYHAVPFPGSRLYNEALEKGWVSDQSFDRFRQDSPMMEINGLKAEVIEKYQKRAMSEFYLRWNSIPLGLKFFKPQNILNYFSLLMSLIFGRKS